jgi:hypothetical protein
MKNLKLRRIVNGVKFLLLSGMFIFFVSIPQVALAHCDSYDGPVIKDALKAFDENKVELVLKWVEEEHETEIKNLFSKTYALKGADKEIYKILEKHFLETLVRLHREGEGESYTGLKPAGSTTAIIVMADKALSENDVDELSTKLNAHIEQVVKEKYEKVAALSKVKEESVENGREYVAAYVDYTHTLEGIHAVLEHGAGTHVAEKH